MYVLFQIVGAIFGALILSQLVPGMSIGMGDGGAGCFDRGMIPSNVTDAQDGGRRLLAPATCGQAHPHSPRIDSGLGHGAVARLGMVFHLQDV